MINVFVNRLNPNEVFVLQKMFNVINYVDYKIIDISNNLEEEVDISINKNLFIFDETKAKSSFEKKIEELFGKQYSEFHNSLRIDKPDTFLKDESSSKEVWDKLSSWLNISKTNISMDIIPDKIPSGVIKALSIGSDEVIEIKTNQETLKIVPNNWTNRKDNEIKYSELIALLTVKLLFGAKEFNIIKDN